ncbi:hypothetical protein FB565_007389 [Actinoplanes lutulentus]|uniref:Effector-associated domain-containing protein n=1 Tax=Actinoplanes lutulentus TaxID=1287878 RepID=A0A327Z3I7_9ACTN|nr:effector-associated domain EAD1-containing protein [Actinoplanes lutulentus]MBB2947618.1 hypothetical protein [Actinoplanes lutulentus]RAK27675.1 hypothetical protein B0I29_12258 [Actinoplanes lutulentus]
MFYCGSGGGTITGDQLRKLEAAILDAYRSRDDLERLLFFSLEMELSHHADPHNPLPMVVFRLIQAAKSGGWLVKLIESILADRSENEALRIWAVTCGFAHASVPQPAPPQDHQLLDSAFFDLDRIKRAIVAAKRHVPGRVLGLGLHSAEGLVVKKLCAWLPYCLGETECKDWLSLSPDQGSVDSQLKRILDYKSDLDQVNVVCPLLTGGASAPAVAALWGGIQERFGAHPYMFVALFVGVDGHPAGVVDLPVPAADATDLTLWAQEVVSRRGWPPTLADSWAMMIADRSAIGDDLDMRRLYEEMDRSIRDVRRAPADFKRRLEEWGSLADPAPR